MVYPEGDRRVVKIRRNRRNYQKGRRRKKAVWFLVIGILFAAGLAAAYYVNLPHIVMSAWEAQRASADSAKNGQVQSRQGADARAAAAASSDAGQEDGADAAEEGSAEAEPEEAAPVTILFTGDVWLDPAVQKNYDAQGIDGVLDEGLLSAMKDADICVINNEFAFSDRGVQASKQYTYRVDPKYVTILNAMGVDIAGLANNHALDFGTEALSDTFVTIDGAGIRYIGAGDSYAQASAPAVVEAGGQTFAFLAATHVIPEVSWNVQNRQPGMFSFYDETGLLDAIAAAKEQYDHVFVLAHWGQMRTTELTDYQINDGRKFIDAGADAVIGAHPHVLQGIESYGGGYVFYSLGDFISTNRIEQTVAVTFTYDADGRAVKIIPAFCSNYRTMTADAARADGVFDLLRSISQTIAIDADGVLSAR